MRRRRPRTLTPKGFHTPGEEQARPTSIWMGTRPSRVSFRVIDVDPHKGNVFGTKHRLHVALHESDGIGSIYQEELLEVTSSGTA